MKTIFIGGSRHVSRFSLDIKDRLDNVIACNHQVVVGDASGADKAVQKHLCDSHYQNVTVYCSGSAPRNNLGRWQVQNIIPTTASKGFQFYAAKDRAMARKADFGMMIWDGKSPGTILNVLRLIQAGKICVLFNVPEKKTLNLKSLIHWREFFSQCSASLRDDVAERATPDEMTGIEIDIQPSFPSSVFEAKPRVAIPDKALAALNHALTTGDATCVVDNLEAIARDSGICDLTPVSSSARESLQNFLTNGENADFTTIVRVFSLLGLRLELKTS